MKYIIIALIFIIIITNLLPKHETKSVLLPTGTILAMGDSLTYGYNAKPEESYPSLLSHMSGFKVINAGIPAETSSDGLKRLPALLENHSIKLMILCFGGNDVIQGVPKQQLKKNIINMVRMAKAKHIEILLISVPNLSLFGLSPLNLYEEISKEENIPLLQGVLTEILEQPSLKSDQIHPNALGYKRMAEKIYEKLKEEGWI